VTQYGSGGFEAFCQDYYGRTRQQVNRWIKAYQLFQEQAEHLVTMVSNFGERHYRELGKLPKKEMRSSAIIQIQDRFGNSPSSRQVQEVVDEMLGKRRPRKTPFYDPDNPGKKPRIFMAEAETANDQYFMKIEMPRTRSNE
jgi:hypothetical protein